MDKELSSHHGKTANGWSKGQLSIVEKLLSYSVQNYASS